MGSENRELVSKLTWEEKTALVEGVDSWSTNAVPEHNIPSLLLTDGPHGLRKVRNVGGGFAISDNCHSTAFPTASAVASSWDISLARQMGEAIAEECVEEGVDVLLAPGINIKRSPLCGRNFEYFSEDPRLSGEMGAAFVEGVQSRGVGASVKHFAANSCENDRFVGNSLVDESALREIYLSAFERVVKKAHPATVMCSYNEINGSAASENRWLLTELLRDEWGFEGLVMTDWGATRDRVKGIRAGCDLEMPGGVVYNRNALLSALADGSLQESELDLCVERVLNLVEYASHRPSGVRADREKNAKLSCRIAKESAVLLKNEGSLPLNREEELLIIGEMFEKLRFQGAGSSLINPPEVIPPKAAFEKRGISFRYCKGFSAFSSQRKEDWEKEALTAAEEWKGPILVFGGLTDFEESEGFDRENMKLGENQLALLTALCKMGKQVVLVLCTGAPVELPFYDGLSALLLMHLSGMHGGEAAAALLFGEETPSGKLAESWPLTAQDSSCAADYDRSAAARYYESIYVGYRFYDKAGTALRFPFGFGLSYTEFEYSALRISEEGDRIRCTLAVKNTGKREGKEVVQLYVSPPGESRIRPEKELRAFCKVCISPGEEKEVTLTFERDDLHRWDSVNHRWMIEEGEYRVLVGSSCREIRLSAPLYLSGEKPLAFSQALLRDYASPPKEVPASFPERLGYPLPVEEGPIPLTMESPLRDFPLTGMGALIYRAIFWYLSRDLKKAVRMPDSLERDSRVKNSYFVLKLLPSNTIRALCTSSGGLLSYTVAVGLVELANGHILRGIRALLHREKKHPLPKEKKTSEN